MKWLLKRSQFSRFEVQEGINHILFIIFCWKIQDALQDDWWKRECYIWLSFWLCPPLLFDRNLVWFSVVAAIILSLSFSLNTHSISEPFEKDNNAVMMQRVSTVCGARHSDRFPTQRGRRLCWVMICQQKEEAAVCSSNFLLTTTSSTVMIGFESWQMFIYLELQIWVT